MSFYVNSKNRILFVAAKFVGFIYKSGLKRVFSSYLLIKYAKNTVLKNQLLAKITLYVRKSGLKSYFSTNIKKYVNFSHLIIKKLTKFKYWQCFNELQWKV